MNESWMEKYEELKGLLACQGKRETYFTSDKVGGLPLEKIEIGRVSAPKGKAGMKDPLVFLNAGEKPYFTEAPKGYFPVAMAGVKSEEWGNRYVAVKVKFTGDRPVRYQEAFIGIENLKGIRQDDYLGFQVGAGLGCITDAEVLPYFNCFVEKLNADNLYDDYFAELFRKSYEAHPENQRAGGDWINWTIPGAACQIPMLARGFCDGSYPVCFAYDTKDRICGLCIRFIDIEVALSDDGEDYETSKSYSGI